MQRDTLAQSTSVLTNHTDKRKHDDTHEPTQDAQQTTKKAKTRHTGKQMPEQISRGHIYAEPGTKDGNFKVRFEEAMNIPSESKGLPRILAESAEKKRKQAARDKERLKGFMDDIRMHPEDPNASTMVVRLPEQGTLRILTASRWPREKDGRIILHDTPISDRCLHRNQHHEQRARSVRPPPFLKPGTHGRHGNFEDDPDRRIGHGHQVDHKDEVRLHEYLQNRGKVLSKYPKFPRVNEQDEAFTAIKQVWDDNELWYHDFTEQYPGHAVNHLWPCGCEKLRGESEDEESEAE
jgi:hypothetical protein